MANYTWILAIFWHEKPMELYNLNEWIGSIVTLIEVDFRVNLFNFFAVFYQFVSYVSGLHWLENEAPSFQNSNVDPFYCHF